MQFLKNILGLDNIYHRKYGYAFFADFLAACIWLMLAWRLSGVNDSLQPVLSVLPIIVALVALHLIASAIKLSLVKRLLKNRHYTSPVAESFVDSNIHSSAVSDELDVADKISLIEVRDNWKLYDVTFDFFRRTKRGKYKSREAYYTVFEAKLRRPVPHLVFDSKKAKGNQFKSVYLNSQKISLEGNFDEHFDTYSPHYYQIDTLSFITPEVMEAMIWLDGIDVEFNKDSILCFAPLLKERELEQFKTKCMRLYDSVNDNLASYRDTRLQAEEARHDTTAFSKKLLKNPRRYLPTMIISGLAAAAIFVISSVAPESILSVQSDERLLVYALIIFGHSMYKYASTKRANARKLAEYHSLYT